MKLYNHELQKFIEFLYDLELIDQKSRMRTRLINLLVNKQRLFSDEYQLMVREHSNLDKHGNPLIIEVGDEKHFDIRDIDAFNKAYLGLLNEEVIIEQNQENKKMLLTIQDIILNCGLSFKGQEAVEYERYCEIVEQIHYNEE